MREYFTPNKLYIYLNTNINSFDFDFFYSCKVGSIRESVQSFFGLSSYSPCHRLPVIEGRK